MARQRIQRLVRQEEEEAKEWTFEPGPTTNRPTTFNSSAQDDSANVYRPSEGEGRRNSHIASLASRVVRILSRRGSQSSRQGEDEPRKHSSMLQPSFTTDFCSVPEREALQETEPPKGSGKKSESKPKSRRRTQIPSSRSVEFPYVRPQFMPTHSSTSPDINRNHKGRTMVQSQSMEIPHIQRYPLMPSAQSSAAIAKGMMRSQAFSGPCKLSKKLSNSQIRVLVASWKHMSLNGGKAIMQRIFAKLIYQRPKIKEVFYKVAFMQIFSRYNGGNNGRTITTLHDHSRLLVKLLDETIGNLSSPNATLKPVQELGKKHAFLAKSGLKPEIWEAFGEVAVEVIGSQDCVKCNADTMRAWTLVVACITDELRFGFETACKAEKS